MPNPGHGRDCRPPSGRQAEPLTAEVCFRPAQCPAPRVHPEHPSPGAFRQFPHSDAKARPELLANRPGDSVMPSAGGGGYDNSNVSGRKVLRVHRQNARGEEPYCCSPTKVVVPTYCAKHLPPPSLSDVIRICRRLYFGLEGHHGQSSEPHSHSIRQP